MRRAPAQGGQHIMQGCRLRAGDDADGFRERRQRPLAFRRKQAFGRQLVFQPQKGFVQIADAGAAYRFHVQLVVAARGVQRDQCPHLDLVAVLRHETDGLRPAAEHHRAHLRRVVFQREIPVAGSGAGKVGHLARDPCQREAALQQAGDGLV